jgi:hypothetical protein
VFFLGLTCYCIHISFNHSLFDSGDLDIKRKKIAFITRKNQADVVQVISALKSRRRLQGWQFQPIENCSSSEVAAILKDSCIFMSFGHPEGISLSNLVAMLSRCWVVGYSGVGCREYFDLNLCEEVPFGDIVSFVETVECAAQRYNTNRIGFNGRVASAQSYVRCTYSDEQERSELIEFYASVTGLAPPL